MECIYAMLDKLFFFLPDAVPMLVAVVGIVLSYKQPKPENHLRTTLILVAAGLVGTGSLSWARKRSDDRQHADLVAAQKEQDARYDSIKSQYDNVSGQLKSIVNFTAHPPSGLSPQQVNEAIRVMAGSGNLKFVSEISNNELRQETATYTKALREMEAQRGQAWSMTQKPANLQPGAEERMAHANAVCERVEKDFRQNYQERGISLRRVLIERLKITGPQPPTILDDAPFYLPDLGHPLDELAEYLDGLAKRLPYP